MIANRIYFVGSHSTGKTTMARWVHEQYNMPMITEVARIVLAETETEVEKLRTDINLVNTFQKKIFDRQIQIEKSLVDGFVSDRAFDNLAYACEHSTIFKELITQKSFGEYINWVSEGIVFFIRPDKSTLSQDGTREIAVWDNIVKIDGMIKLMLEQFGIKYLPINTANMQERVRTVEFILGKS